MDSATLQGSVLALPVTECDLSKLLNPMCLSFLHLQNGYNGSIQPEPHKVITRGFTGIVRGKHYHSAWDMVSSQ